MTIVDAHHHVWQRAQQPQTWIDPIRMAKIDADFTLDDLPADHHGVGATVVVQTLDSLAETRHLMQLPSPVAGVVGWVDILGDVGAQVAALRAAPGGERLVGIRTMVQAEHDPHYLERMDVRAGIADVGRAGLAFDLILRPDQLRAAGDLVESLPGQRFVLDHLGKPDPTDLRTWRADLARLARSPDLTAKLSGLATEAAWSTWTVDDLRPLVEHALDVLGPHRLMFGSDWPVCLLATSYGRWIHAVGDLLSQLAAGERQAIFGTTALRTYQLQLDLTDEKGEESR